jgi:hypothetical protein
MTFYRRKAHFSEKKSAALPSARDLMAVQVKNNVHSVFERFFQVLDTEEIGLTWG